MGAALLGYFVGSLPLGFLIARGTARHRLCAASAAATSAPPTSIARPAAGSACWCCWSTWPRAPAARCWRARCCLAAHEHAAALAGLAAVVGHIYPIWLRFVGGKGVAVACRGLLGAGAAGDGHRGGRVRGGHLDHPLRVARVDAGDDDVPGDRVEPRSCPGGRQPGRDGRGGADPVQASRQHRAAGPRHRAPAWPSRGLDP